MHLVLRQKKDVLAFDCLLLAISVIFAIITYYEAISPNASMIAISAVLLMILIRPKDSSKNGNPFQFLIYCYALFLISGFLVDESFRVLPPLKARNLTFLSFFTFTSGLIIGNLIGSIFRDQRSNAGFVFKIGYARILVIISIFAYFILVLRLGQIPLLARDPDLARFRFFQGAGHIAIFFHGLPIINLAFLFRALNNGAKSSMRASHVLVLITLLLQLLVGMRGVFLATGLFYFLMYIRIKNINIKTIYLVTILFFGVVFLCAVGAFRRFGTVDLKGMFFELVVIVTARTEVLGWIVERMPDGHTLGWTSYFADLSRLLPGITNGQNVELRHILIGDGGPMHENAELNSGLIGEAYLNSGRIGVFIVPLLFGFLNSILFHLAAANRHSFFHNATFAVLFSYLVVAITSGISTRMPQLLILFIWIIIASLLFGRTSRRRY